MTFNFKKYAPVIFGAGIFILAVFGWMQSCRASKLSIDFQLAEAQRKLSDSQYKQEKATHIADRAKWEQNIQYEHGVQADKDKEIAKLKSEKLVISEKLIAEKAKTAALTPNELVFNLVSRVGPEVKLTGLKTYDFTRLGAENTWNIFLDERGSFDLLQKEKATTGELGDKVVSLQKENSSTASQRDSLQIDLTNCDKAKVDAEKAKDAAVKANGGQRWKGRKEGALFAVVVAVVAKLAGWIK